MRKTKKFHLVVGLLLMTGFLNAVQLSEGKIPTDHGIQVVLLSPERKKQVKVLGEVKNPGKIDWSKDLTLREAIAKAGGLKRLANLRKVKVTRNGKTTTYHLKGDTNPKVEPGDIIKVETRIFRLVGPRL